MSDLGREIRVTEEATGVCYPLPDLREPETQQSHQGPWSPVEPPHLNGLPGAGDLADTEEQVNETYRGIKATQPTDEADDQWAPMTLPVYPMSCPSVPLSFATVQWDMPDPSTETPSPMTDNSSADELDSSGAASLDWTVSPLSHHHQQQADLSPQGDAERCNRLEEQMPMNVHQDDGSLQVCWTDRKRVWFCNLW